MPAGHPDSPLVVGVVNATPDSFSGAGRRSVRDSIDLAERLIADGADIIEVGGESNVSNTATIPVDDEIARISPVVSAVSGWGAVAVAIDTSKAAVARRAIELGAGIVSDIGGFADQRMIDVCAGSDADVVLVHSGAPPKTSVWDDRLYEPDGVVATVRRWGATRMAALGAAGISPSRITFDPGPDLGKTPAQTIEMLRELASFADIGGGLMLAASRKDFIGALLNRRPRERLGGSLAAALYGAEAGVTQLRVHDVRETVDALRIWRTLRGRSVVDPALRIDESVRREAQERRFDFEAR